MQIRGDGRGKGPFSLQEGARKAKKAIKWLGGSVGVERNAPTLALEQKQKAINRINKKNPFKKRKESCLLPSREGICCSQIERLRC